MAEVTFVDETTSGARGEAWRLAVAQERLTLREVIRRRIFQEVAEYNARQSGEPFQGLVRPTGTRAALNGRRPHAWRRIEPQRQYELAVAAFGRNGFLVLVGDRQVTELDEEIDLGRDAEITFLKLVPLVGG